ncbi:FUSC family protein [Geminicoccus harenae]|uniref:FUSC family protein n=3 Tax=Geminicoccus harenae TaxID=2498453 RepID=UPI001C96711E|nr:FUSC family protein [Geminicoccus harenae]
MAGLGRTEILFSVKTFLAALLALWVALSLDLPKPYWAMGTVFIVAHPLAGAVTSKAVYRVLGTLIGAVASVALVPNLIDAPELLCLALAIWVGGCLFVSLLDRTPRSYVFMLAGYTAAIIGFSSVTEPALVFDTALARTLEITLGILCSALVSRVLFPRHVGPIVTGRIDRWLADAGSWANDVLLRQSSGSNAEHARRRLAADTVDLVALSTHLAYDTSRYRHSARQMRVLQQRMIALLPILSALRDRLAGDPPSAGMAVLLEAIAAWIGQGLDAPAAEAHRLRQEIAALRPEQPRDWDRLLQASLCARLDDLIDIWSDCLILHQDIMAGREGLPSHLRMSSRYAGDEDLHRDVGMAALSGVAATVGTLVCCVFWIATGWQEGGTAAQMGAVFCSIFATMDNPVPMLRRFTLFLCLSLVLILAYQFAVLPMVTGFEGLALVLAPVLLVSGAFMATASWGLAGFTVSANVPMMLALQSRFDADFAAFTNNALATVAGVLAATAVTAILRSIGAEQSARRLLRAGRRDIARAASREQGQDLHRLIRRVVDRLGLLAPRLAGAGGEVRDTDAVLADLRAGLNIMELRSLRHALTPDDRRTVAALLDPLSRHFQGERADPGSRERLAAGLDAVMPRLMQRTAPDQATDAALLALFGIRRAILPAGGPVMPKNPV